jgi:hypothetical protein
MGVKNEIFPLKCIWLLLHCLALPRWQVIGARRQAMHRKILMATKKPCESRRPSRAYHRAAGHSHLSNPHCTVDQAQSASRLPTAERRFEEFNCCSPRWTRSGSLSNHSRLQPVARCTQCDFRFDLFFSFSFQIIFSFQFRFSFPYFFVSVFVLVFQSFFSFSFMIFFRFSFSYSFR